jgi:hypothetical protein
MERMSQMNNTQGIAIRTTPQIAHALSHDKSIRELSSMDKIDIATRHNGPHRSIIYVPPEVHIKKTKKKEGYSFFF